MTPVYLEIGTKRVFACAVDWPGWCRSAKTDDEALEQLRLYAARYAPVAAAAHARFPTRHTFEITERLAGSATTDFGAPGAISSADRTAKPTARVLALLEAAWATFEAVVASAPPSLRKGPRGGGRDRDAIATHVLGAEAAYARKVGAKLREPAFDDQQAVAAFRHDLVEAVRTATSTPWPAVYAARRMAWHALDHAWEIEDRST